MKAKYKNIIKLPLWGVGGLWLLLFCSCNGYLDTLPDNRTEIDTEEKVEYLLTSAYAGNDFQLIAEFMSDNVDDMGTSNPYSDRFVEQVANWQDVTETSNESPERIWNGYYKAIATANQALQSISEIEAKSGTTTALKQTRSEALMCRAYAHFILVNMFALHYSAANADKPGITYMEKPETTLNPKYTRNTIGEVYAKIDKDIQEALPNVSSSYMTVPKYHFNETAAYAFAARFYLFYEQYDKVIEYATKVLGSSPQSMLKNYAKIGKESTPAAQSQAYIDATDNGNLLLTTAYSSMGQAFGPYTTYKRYAHNLYTASMEDVIAPQPWASSTNLQATDYNTTPHSVSATNVSCYIFLRIPYLFEFTDPVAGIGYRRAVFPELTTNETLLDRAEAYAMLKDFDNAAKDINLWIADTYKTYKTVTPASIQTFYAKYKYCYEGNTLTSTPKKHLNPGFEIDVEGSMQESMLQAVISARRIETLGIGKRWFDIKRWGIEFPRRLIKTNGYPDTALDWLLKDDSRRAVQIPQKVTDAGYEANPRTSNQTDGGSELPLDTDNTTDASNE